VCECASTRPGIAVRPDPSITFASLGTETRGPISRITPSRITIDTCSSTSPVAVQTESRFWITSVPRGAPVVPGSA
jgi:hypothetical protein